METLPPDPYQALGLSRTSTSAEIKTTYRKAALRCHPDKAPNKADEFVRIQQAYEILGDEDKRRQYDIDYVKAQRLESLRDEVPGSRAGSVRGARSSARTASGSSGPNVTTFSFGTGSGNFFATSSTRVHEESGMRRSPASSGDDRAEERTSKGAAAGLFGLGVGLAEMLAEQVINQHRKRSETQRPAMQQRKSSRSDEPERSRSTRDQQRDQQRERDRFRERDQARERQQKYAYHSRMDEDSDSDDVRTARVREAEQRRALEKERARYEAEKERKRRDSTRESTREYDDPRDERHRNATDYIRSMKSSPPRPTTSGRDGIYENRPGLDRRTSTRQPETRSSGYDERRGGERRASEAGDHAAYRTSNRPQPPPLNTSRTSPSAFRGPQSASPTASRRTQAFDDDDGPIPSPNLRRAQTLPVERPELRRSNTTRGGRTTEPERPSNLRYHETHDSGYSTSSPSESPAPSFAPPPKVRSTKLDDEVRQFMEPNRGENTRPAMARQPSVSKSRKSPEREAPREHRAERPTINTSFRAPPPARSASYAQRQTSGTTTASTVPASPSSRRPSLSRTDSMRHNSTSTRATTASEYPRTPATPLKTGDYFDSHISQSPADYSSHDLPFRDRERDRDRSSRDNARRTSYAPNASAAEAGKARPSSGEDGFRYVDQAYVQDARPSGSNRRESYASRGEALRSPGYDDLRARDGGGRERRGGGVESSDRRRRTAGY